MIRITIKLINIKPIELSTHRSNEITLKKVLIPKTSKSFLVNLLIQPF